MKYTTRRLNNLVSYVRATLRAMPSNTKDEVFAKEYFRNEAAEAFEEYITMQDGKESITADEFIQTATDNTRLNIAYNHKYKDVDHAIIDSAFNIIKSLSTTMDCTPSTYNAKNMKYIMEHRIDKNVNTDMKTYIDYVYEEKMGIDSDEYDFADAIILGMYGNARNTVNANGADVKLSDYFIRNTCMCIAKAFTIY